MALRAQFGLDDPVWQRYFHWLVNMLQGDWGFSFVSRIDVDKLIWQRLPVTIAVIGLSQVLALLIALPVGVLAAVKPYSWFDRIASTLRLHRLRAADLLHRRAVHPVLQHLPRLAAFRLPRRPVRDRLGLVGGAVQAVDHADRRARPVPGRELDALRALERARRGAPRLRDDGAQQGADRARRHQQARGAQRADPGRHAGGAADAGGVRRRHRHRADLPHPRHRQPADRRHPAQRHAGHHGRDLRLRDAGRSCSTSSPTSSMAGSIPASPTADAAAQLPPGTPRRQARGPWARGLAPLQAPPPGVLEPVRARRAGAGGAARAAGLQGRHQRHRLPGAPGRPEREASAGHRRPRARRAGTRAVRRAHLAGRRHGGDADGHHRRRAHRLAGRHRARLARHGADVGHRPVPQPAAAAAAAAADLPVPRAAEADVRARGRHLHPHRGGDRRLPLDAGGPSGARAVLQPAREGVRRGGARAGRQHRDARCCATSCPTAWGR